MCAILQVLPIQVAPGTGIVSVCILLTPSTKSTGTSLGSNPTL